MSNRYHDVEHIPASPADLRKIRKFHQHQEEVRTARQRFAPDSEDEENVAARFTPLQPKLVTSKSEGRANALPSWRRQHSILSAKPVTQSTERGPIGVRDKVARPFFDSTPELHRSLESRSSVSSSETAMGAAVALEQGLITSQTYSNSTYMTDEGLVAIAQRATTQLQAMSKRPVIIGQWKRLARSKPECQVYESLSKAKDQFSVMVSMNLPCSLQEILTVFSTANEAEFHRSMEAVFGDQYVYGINVRSVDCAAYDEDALGVGRRASEDSLNDQTLSVQSAKLKLNAVSLMQKHRLVWKQRNMTFLDYFKEERTTKSFTRVMQTMDMQDEELEFSAVTNSSPTGASNSHDYSSQCHLPNGDDLHQKLQGIVAGYVIQEVTEEKLTRVFFYATHRHRSTGQTRLPRSAVQLLRVMVKKVCHLKAVVLRRRLGYYPLSRLPTSPDEALLATYCAACFGSFSLLRKKYYCRLCSHYTCRKCSDLHDVEITVGLIERHRVCVSCVQRVGTCVFTMPSFPPLTSPTVSDEDWVSARAQLPLDEFDTPMMDQDASEDIEDVELVHTNQVGKLAGFVSNLLHSKQDKKREFQKKELAVRQKQRLQLTIDDLNSWASGPTYESTGTPKESISLLDSFCTSNSSASWSSPSPTEA